MIEIDWRKCSTVPAEHQKVGTRIFVKETEPEIGRIVPNVFINADEVGGGKTKQTIDAASILYENGVIDTVVVVAPQGAINDVWGDPDPALGEIALHGWKGFPNHVIEYSADAFPSKAKRVLRAPDKPGLVWVLTNYEFIRYGLNKRGAISGDRLDPLREFLATRKYALVCDEAWMIKNHQSLQWRACFGLRLTAKKVWQLNGSPVADKPLDLYAAGRLFDRSILEWMVDVYRKGRALKDYCGFVAFRAHYAKLKPGVSYPMILDWQNLEELREKIAPYILRRKTADVWDLPPLLDDITIKVPLTASSWEKYREMREEAVAWVRDAERTGTSLAMQAPVKAMRLAQITSGYLGGVEIVKDFEDASGNGERLDLLKGIVEDEPGLVLDFANTPEKIVVEIGREKLDATIAFLLARQPIDDRVLVWSRFRLEIERAAREIERLTGRRMRLIYGQQKRAERREAVLSLSPRFTPTELVGVSGHTAAGGAALNLAGAALAIYMSAEAKLRAWIQSRGRLYRKGQARPVQYVHVEATGPKGQRTVDAGIYETLREKKDIADWTASTWRAILEE